LYAPVEFLDGAMAIEILTWVREDGRGPGGGRPRLI
jgi:hypothetical protein